MRPRISFISLHNQNYGGEIKLEKMEERKKKEKKINKLMSN